MSKKLTDKQEHFSQLVVKYGNQSKAYREAYDVSETTKDNVIHNEASKLMTNHDVTVRVAQIRKDRCTNHGIDIGFIIEGLKEVIDDVDYTIDLGKLKDADTETIKSFYRMKEVTSNTDKLRAIDMLTKMLGLNAPDRTQQDIRIEIVEKKRD